MIRLAGLKGRFYENVVSNYVTVAWTSALGLVLIPVYLRLLGAQQWGVVAVCMTIQGFLTLLDAGLGQVLPRDVARVAGDPAAEARVYQLFWRAYQGLALVGFAAGQLAVPWLVGHWLNGGEGRVAGTELALRLVLFQFLFDFPNNANTGYWSGVQEQRSANLRSCAFTTARHACAVLAVVFWRQDALGYMLPFAVFTLLECGTNRFLIRRRLHGHPAEPRWSDYQVLVREAGAVSAGVLLGILVSQCDRLVLSRVVDLASYGRYLVVANLGLAFLQLQYPLMRALLPSIASRDSTHVPPTVRSQIATVAALCILPCAVGILLAPWLLQAWLHDPDIVREGTGVLRLILAAVALNAIYNVIYQRILAWGTGRTILFINVCGVLVTYPATIVLAQHFGVIAGGYAWLIACSMQLLLGTAWLLVYKPPALRAQGFGSIGP